MTSAPDGGWVLPPAELRIDEGGVQLWRINLNRELPERVEAVLPLDEVARSKGFRFERDRHRYLLSNFALREILSRYLGMPSGDIPILDLARGKPYLSEGEVGQKISFSLSHTANTAMVAVARGRVGVDVEEAVYDYPHMEVAERFFAKGEVEALRGEKDGLKRMELFFNYWTRKEALLKATGEGLYEGLKSIDLSGMGTTVDYGGSRWTVAELEPDGKLFCCVVLEGSLTHMERYQWEPLKQG
jgi:4'-phosphopantetheinyl transferase